MDNKVKDAVCGMDFDLLTMAGKSEYKGKTCYFYSNAYKVSFDKESEKYINKTNEPTHQR